MRKVREIMKSVKCVKIWWTDAGFYHDSLWSLEAYHPEFVWQLLLCAHVGLNENKMTENLLCPEICLIRGLYSCAYFMPKREEKLAKRSLLEGLCITAFWILHRLAFVVFNGGELHTCQAEPDHSWHPHVKTSYFGLRNHNTHLGSQSSSTAPFVGAHPNFP